jgi:hypothetical protein
VNIPDANTWPRTLIVDMPTGSSVDEIDEAAAQEMSGSLCHQCGHNLALGDFDLHLIEDEDGTEVYTAPEQITVPTGLYVTRHDGDLTVWRHDPDRPLFPHELTPVEMAEALAALLPDHTDTAEGN